MNHPLTQEELRRWEDYGAIWRALEVTDSAVTVQLCTCSGEPVELARSSDPDVIMFVRGRLGPGSEDAGSD